MRGVSPSVVAALAAAATLAGCAQAPATTEVVPAPTAMSSRSVPQVVEHAIAQHRQLAQKHALAGDLAGAATEWHIVALLAPEDEATRREYEAARAALRRAVAERVQQGNAAAKNGDNDAAASAYARALVLDPDNAE